MTDRMPGFSTLAIHAGAAHDAATGARATPIYQTTSFVFDDVDHAASLFGLQAFGNIYTRIGNPTCAVLEERIAALEGGTAGLAVASGHAAQVLVMHAMMTPGDEFVASKKLYGGSINQFNHSYKNFGWNVVWADPDDLSSFEKGISAKTKAIFDRLSKQLADEFDSLRVNNNLDLGSRKGKQPGGYQSTLNEVRQPFIFMNAAGLQRDVDTLLHEGGHAFHAIAAKDEPLVFLRHAPMEFCEVASMSMELFGVDHLDVFYSSADDHARAKRQHLEGIIRFFPWMAMSMRITTNASRSLIRCHGDRRSKAAGSMRCPSCSIAVTRRVRRRAANAGSSTTTLASRASSRLKGSRLDEPIVTQWPSIAATLACRKLGAYSWISTPARSSALNTGRDA